MLKIRKNDMNILRLFSKFLKKKKKKAKVMTPDYKGSGHMFLLRKRKIIYKFSLLPLLTWSTAIDQDYPPD